MPEDAILVAVLAAGASRRLGTPKQLVSVGGVPLARRQCSVALAANVGPVVIVTGSRAADVAAAVAGLQVDVCVNPDWEEGLATSLRCAVVAARLNRARALLVFACDQYPVTTEDLVGLSSAWRHAGRVACVSRAGDHLGPPAVLPADCYDAVLRLHGDMGARSVLFDADRPHPLEVENPRAKFDLDHPHDLEALGC